MLAFSPPTRGPLPVQLCRLFPHGVESACFEQVLLQSPALLSIHFPSSAKVLFFFFSDDVFRLSSRRSPLQGFAARRGFSSMWLFEGGWSSLAWVFPRLLPLLPIR